MLNTIVLDGPQTKEVIKLICHLNGIGIKDLLLEMENASGEKVSAAGYADRKDFSQNWKRHLAVFAQKKMTPRNRATLQTFIRHTLRIDRSVMSDLGFWIKEAELTIPKEFERALNVQGEITFVLLRLTGDGSLKVAPMSVVFDPEQQVWPRFQTSRERLRGKPEILQGMIFQIDSYVYSVGKVSGLGGIRLAKLSIHPRKRDERGNTIVFDLYGIRLGHSKTLRRPFAHPLYAYFLEEHHKEKLDRLMKSKTFKELVATKVFSKDEIHDIRTVLEQKRLIDGGLLIEDMLDGA
ncbi:hypothetical protein [uncultured Roseobacter sp.]|uniref:hypothetical protein n=1 Tax=uncultured Roseobacter sp. TaxID=114847 RepID=UPI00261ED4D6|nr:hypothetical protein [uncultured Roseobacter sp.]